MNFHQENRKILLICANSTDTILVTTETFKKCIIFLSFDTTLYNIQKGYHNESQ